MSDAENTTLVIHAIHGTWPYGALKQRRLSKHGHNTSLHRLDHVPWFYETSTFAQDLLKATQARWHTFEWDGRNSFEARRIASIEFSRKLMGFLDEPNTRHVIIAHSHGGTLVPPALNLLSAGDLQKIDGVITMGTPFITFKSTGRSPLRTAQFFVSRLVPFAFLLYPLAAILAYFAAPSTFVSSSLVLFLGLLFVFFLIATQERLIDWVFGARRGTGALFDAFAGAPQLKHPIIALRASADEASLVIGASQLINFVAGQLWKWTIQIGAGTFLRLLDRSQNTWPKYILFLGSSIALCGLVGKMSGAYRFNNLTGTDWDKWIDVTITFALGLYTLGIWLVLAVSAILLLTAFILGPGILLVSLAAGPEVLQLSGLAEVECEPVPSGMTAMVETLQFTLEDEEILREKGGLRHSFYELPTARRRVAELIRGCIG